MGVNLSHLIIKHEKKLEDLKGNKAAIDAFNMLYQFISSIRQPDGTPLMDFNGNITSHLSGLFYRTINFVKYGLTPIYVFDGKPPSFKIAEIKRRRREKEEASLLLEKAEDIENEEEILRYKKASVRLKPEMVKEGKELLNAMGIQYVEAPSEGEAQAAYMAKEGVVNASASQDYDSLLFGSPRLIRNLSITGKRKLPRRDDFVIIHVEEVLLNENLKHLNITQKQLILIGLMIGTDFNAGIKGIGPKKALQIIKKKKEKEIISMLKEKDPSFNSGEVDIEEVISFFNEPPVKEVEIEPIKPNVDAIKDILVEKHDFSESRVEKAINDYISYLERTRQRTLATWFK